MSEINRQLGIDFGTTTSAMAFRDDKGDVQPVTINQELYTPTLILEEENGQVAFGKEAGSYFQSNGTLQSNFKLNLLSPDESVFAEGKELTERFFEFLHREYRDFEETEQRITDSDDKVTIVRTIVTYPGKFSDKAKMVLENAAKAAGFPNVQMVTEAEAAMMYAMKYSNNRFNQITEKSGGKPLTIMMIDMGGGTMDIAVFHYDVKNRILDQKPLLYPAKGRGSNFGGKEIDSLLMKYYEGCSDTPLAESPSAYRDLEMNIKNHKETRVSPQLNKNETAREPQFLWKNKKASIDRSKFESILKDYLEKFPNLVNGALDAAEKAGKLEDHNIDAVILTGGNSQWYFVREMLLNQKLIRLPKVQNEPERIVEYVTKNNLNYALTIIAMGAACYGKQPTATPVPQPAASPDPKERQENIYASVYADYCTGNCFFNLFGCETHKKFCSQYCKCDIVCTVFNKENCCCDSEDCHNVCYGHNNCVDFGLWGH